VNVARWSGISIESRAGVLSAAGKRGRLPCVAAAALLAGCGDERVQSMLHPAGPAAAKIDWLWWILFYVLTVAFVIVVAMMFYAIFRRPGEDRAAAPLGDKFIITTGIVLPSIVLIVLLVLSLETTIALNATAQGLSPARPLDPEAREQPLTIRVIGHQWWWEVRYPPQDRIEREIPDANELYIPVGEPVRLELLAHDVIHSFWVPELHGKMDMLPEAVNHFWIQADTVTRWT
jgi:cytochrome c oxidase subunit II